ncbi:MAG: GNAT family N-acetyltransferase [Dehalococcoidales bacterium]|nr:GNAT family N-acetyltransferase [Dehalococcoidales bacterium]
MVRIIRKALPEDIAGITEIYNEAILNTDATFDTQPKTLSEQRKWYKAHGPRNPIMVAEENGVILGWGSLSEWSTRCAYAETAEISLYIRREYRRQGLGKKLMQALINEGKRAGLHTILSRITGGNEVSVKLHRQYGFEHIGTMREVGNKRDKLLDVEMMQLMLGKD